MIIEEIISKVKDKKRTIILPEALDIKILDAASKSVEFANIILIGDESEIKKKAFENNINIEKATIINPATYENIDTLINRFYELRKNKGLTLEDANKIIKNDKIYFSTMLVELDYADGMVAGIMTKSSDVLRSALQIVKTKTDSIASSYILISQDNKDFGCDGNLLFADCGINQNPSSEELVEIAKQTSNSFVKLFNKEPKISFLSHSTNSSSICSDQEKVKKAAELFKEKYKDIISGGEMQLDCAIVNEVAERKFPNSDIKGDANILIFPNLDSGNIAYKLVERFASAKAYGPIITNLNKPINDLSRGSSIDDIVGVIAITCLECE